MAPCLQGHLDSERTAPTRRPEGSGATTFEVRKGSFGCTGPNERRLGGGHGSQKEKVSI